jgi:hypothetical protein
MNDPFLCTVLSFVGVVLESTVFINQGSVDSELTSVGMSKRLRSWRTLEDESMTLTLTLTAAFANGLHPPS